MICRTLLALLTCLVMFAAVPAGCTTTRPTESVRDRADYLFNRGQYRAAAEEYAVVVSRYPGDWRAQYQLGRSLMEVDDLNGARRALEVAHSQQPGHDGIAAALAEVMFLQGDEQHLFAFLRQRAESSHSTEAYLTLGRYAMEMGDPDSARLALETAIAVDDERSVEPYLVAAEFAEHVGDIELATRRLQQAYGINPYDERVRARLRALGEVPGPTLALPPGR